MKITALNSIYTAAANVGASVKSSRIVQVALRALNSLVEFFIALKVSFGAIAVVIFFVEWQDIAIICRESIKGKINLFIAGL